MAGAGAKPLEWLPGARRAFDTTLNRIVEEDPETAELAELSRGVQLKGTSLDLIRKRVTFTIG